MTKKHAFLECDHIKKVAAWGVEQGGNANFYVKTWGCTKCDWTEENGENK